MHSLLDLFSPVFPFFSMASSLLFSFFFRPNGPRSAISKEHNHINWESDHLAFAAEIAGDQGEEWRMSLPSRCLSVSRCLFFWKRGSAVKGDAVISQQQLRQKHGKSPQRRWKRELALTLCSWKDFKFCLILTRRGCPSKAHRPPLAF